MYQTWNRISIPWWKVDEKSKECGPPGVTTSGIVSPWDRRGRETEKSVVDPLTVVRNCLRQEWVETRNRRGEVVNFVFEGWRKCLRTTRDTAKGEGLRSGRRWETTPTVIVKLVTGTVRRGPSLSCHWGAGSSLLLTGGAGGRETECGCKRKEESNKGETVKTNVQTVIPTEGPGKRREKKVGLPSTWSDWGCTMAYGWPSTDPLPSHYCDVPWGSSVP